MITDHYLRDVRYITMHECILIACFPYFLWIFLGRGGQDFHAIWGSCTNLCGERGRKREEEREGEGVREGEGEGRGERGKGKRERE